MNLARYNQKEMKKAECPCRKVAKLNNLNHKNNPSLTHKLVHQPNKNKNQFKEASRKNKMKVRNTKKAAKCKVREESRNQSQMPETCRELTPWSAKMSTRKD